MGVTFSFSFIIMVFSGILLSFSAIAGVYLENQLIKHHVISGKT